MIHATDLIAVSRQVSEGPARRPAAARAAQAAQVEQVARVAVVIPCYNEARRLDLAAFDSFLAKSRQIRLVMVDDGSTDDTRAVLTRLQRRWPGRVEVLALSRNAGKAEAVRQGLLHASRGAESFVGYWDADLATPLEAIEDFAAIGARYDHVGVIYGARLRLLGHQVQRDLSRRIVSAICVRLARFAIGLPVGDTQCGAKLLRNGFRLHQVLATPFQAGWLFDVELFARLAEPCGGAGGAVFYEYPLPEWHEVPGSKVTGRAIRRAGLAMLQLIARRRFGLCLGPARGMGPETLASVQRVL